MRVQNMGSVLCAFVSVLGVTNSTPVSGYSFLDEKPGDLFSTLSQPRPGSCNNATLSTGTPTGTFKNVSGSMLVTTCVLVQDLTEI